ncbi:NAD-dependent epimerase/dehydratase family protein [Pedobacter duraquae]|uniref:Nucleoside-diphosphate-sugar epimerase n=1 Tax=Pedobacter duraquae TaxID=425511 RepID=A0A4R6IJ61_9SPHI|nr:NAD-dependent epimerase/dehydratase family protein [Pedobacter duraquae]TDO21965.1 nucleoside-diphosphate-sugar epimerase [Pedobacter duraquae]
MLKVIITGITGFLGSHIAERALAENIIVIGLKRKSSSIWRCEHFKERVDWVNIEDGYEDILVRKSADILIHAAWMGVEAKDRDNWVEQTKNITFFSEILTIVKRSKIEKVICLGSQAEYGFMEGAISEEASTGANGAYGAVKLASLHLFRSFSEIYQTKWIWLRLFSVFGENEGSNWLIPSLAAKMQSGVEFDLTLGEQRYAYLYVKDFAEITCRILKQEIVSGIYNVSGDEPRSLKEMVESIRNIIKPDFRLNFGALAYRPNQSMYLEGDMTKLTSQIGKFNFTNFNVALLATLKGSKFI